MPTYEFQCQTCGHSFSVITSWARKKETQCPACGGQELQELFGNYRVGTLSGSNGGGACGPVG
jgi:putative FmdB family regulatory protein